VFSSIHPRTANVKFTFNLSVDAGSNYNVTKTSSAFLAYHNEADTDTSLIYDTAADLAQSTAFQPLNTASIGSGADESFSGSMILFNPSSTTYVKHFISTANHYRGDIVYTYNDFIAGYGNTTSAVNAIRFQMSSGNFDGTIYLYGIK
jgi:hypothetical protein